jgi:uncharacterized membrane protein
MLRGMVVANTTEVAGTMDLAMAVSSAIVTSHLGVVDSVVIIEGLLRRSMRVGGRRCMGKFRIFLFNKRGRRRCIGS